MTLAWLDVLVKHDGAIALEFEREGARSVSKNPKVPDTVIRNGLWFQSE